MEDCLCVEENVAYMATLIRFLIENSMDAIQLKVARESYAYVPAHLVANKIINGAQGHDLEWGDVRFWSNCPSQKEWDAVRAYIAAREAAGASFKPPREKIPYSSIDLDNFHNALIHDESVISNLHALKSIMFWGFASGTDHRIRVPRTIGKARMLAVGRAGKRPSAPDSVGDVIRVVREVQAHVSNDKLGEALDSAYKMAFWGDSFASKLVMFACPEKAVVYDAVIWQRLHNHSDEQLHAMAQVRLSASGSSGRAAVKKQYQAWCDWCSAKAKELNDQMVKWRDWDNEEHAWRAVDVERAFFALG